MRTRNLGPIATAILLTLVLVPFAEPTDEEVDRFVLEIQGMVWAECAHSVEEALLNVTGVISAEVDLITGEVTVEAKPERVRAEQIVEAANNATDSVHSFKAKLKKGPQRVKRVQRT